MQMVLNELSYKFPANTVWDGQEVMKKFLLLFIKGTEAGLEDKLIVRKTFDGTLLSKGYPIEKWRNDEKVDIEIRRFYKRLNEKAEFIENELEEELKAKEFQCTKGPGMGFLIANELECLAISFFTDTIWDSNIVAGKISTVDEENELVVEECEVYHASKEKHVDDNLRWIEKKLSEKKFNIINGQDLWRKREELYPHLIFCSSTRRNIFNLQKKELRQVLKKLELLESYFKTWDGCSFVREAIPNVDPESDVTLSQFKGEHTFITPDNRKIIFSWHIRFTGDYAGRIFFEPDRQTKKGIIGHIGNKLPTVKYTNP